MPIITEKELNKIAEFYCRTEHRYHTVVVEITSTGIGKKKTVRCRECKSKREDITDYDSW